MEEAHRRNALRKALEAVEIIETQLLPVWINDPGLPINSLHEGLTYIRAALFDRPNDPASTGLWAVLGFHFSMHRGVKGHLTEFNTSRPYLRAELDNRIRETDPNRAAPTDDPFAIFSSNASAKN